jgi:hypothetical protein
MTLGLSITPSSSRELGLHAPLLPRLGLHPFHQAPSCFEVIDVIGRLLDRHLVMGPSSNFPFNAEQSMYIRHASRRVIQSEHQLT